MDRYELIGTKEFALVRRPRSIVLTVNGQDKLEWGLLDTSANDVLEGQTTIAELVRNIKESYL